MLLMASPGFGTVRPGVMLLMAYPGFGTVRPGVILLMALEGNPHPREVKILQHILWLCLLVLKSEMSSGLA